MHLLSHVLEMTPGAWLWLGKSPNPQPSSPNPHLPTPIPQSLAQRIPNPWYSIVLSSVLEVTIRVGETPCSPTLCTSIVLSNVLEVTIGVGETPCSPTPFGAGQPFVNRRSRVGGWEPNSVFPIYMNLIKHAEAPAFSTQSEVIR